MSLLIRNLNKSTNNTIISRAKPCILQILPPHFSQQSQSLQVQQQVRWGRTVRIILQNDLPSGKGYAGDVMEVKAGYARNHLIPQKIAYYATPENFERFNITDPLLLKKDGLSKEEDGKEDKVEVSEDQKEADRLRKYLKNKTLKIWRNIDASTGKCHPGMVDAKALRDKLSKQLKIYLEDHETIQIHPEQVNFLELDMEERQFREMEQQLKLQELQQRQQQQNSSSSSVVGNESAQDEGVPQVEKKKQGGIEGYIAKNIKEYDAERDDSIELKDLGEYIAMIHLAGGFSVPLKFVVLKR